MRMGSHVLHVTLLHLYTTNHLPSDLTHLGVQIVIVGLILEACSTLLVFTGLGELKVNMYPCEAIRDVL